VIAIMEWRMQMTKNADDDDIDRKIDSPMKIRIFRDETLEIGICKTLILFQLKEIGKIVTINVCLIVEFFR